MTTLAATGEPDPATLLVGTDAFTGGEPVAGPFAAAYARWTLASAEIGEHRRLVPAEADPGDWRDDRIGWGVVLPDVPGLDPAALARAEDAPEPIRRLVEARHGRVLRYRADSAYADWTLRDYAGSGDLLTAASPPGSGPLQPRCTCSSTALPPRSPGRSSTRSTRSAWSAGST